MQTANIILDIGGDNGNQIPKSGVTAAEIAVLIAIHGEAAVHDIEPTATIPRSNRDERARLYEQYGHAKDGEDRSIVGTLFPGAAARVFEKIDELGLPAAFFKPTARAGTESPASGLEALTVAQLKELAEKNGVDLGDATKKADIIAALELAAEKVDEDTTDDVTDMPDNTDAGANLFT